MLLIIWKYSTLFSETGCLAGFEMFLNPTISLLSCFYLHCRLHNQLLCCGSREERNRLHNKRLAGQDLMPHRLGQVCWLEHPCWDTPPKGRHQVGRQRLRLHRARWGGNQWERWAGVKLVVQWKRCCLIFYRGPEMAHGGIESLAFFVRPLPSRSLYKWILE